MCPLAWERGIWLASRLVVMCDMMGELSGNVRVVRKERGQVESPRASAGLDKIKRHRRKQGRQGCGGMGKG